MLLRPVVFLGVLGFGIEEDNATSIYCKICRDLYTSDTNNPVKVCDSVHGRIEEKLYCFFFPFSELL